MSNLSGTKDRLKLAGNPVAYGKTWGAGDWAGNSLRALRTSYMIMATAYLLQEVIKGIISSVGKIRKGKETGNGKGKEKASTSVEVEGSQRESSGSGGGDGGGGGSLVAASRRKLTGQAKFKNLAIKIARTGGIYTFLSIWTVIGLVKGVIPSPKEAGVFTAWNAVNHAWMYVPSMSVNFLRSSSPPAQSPPAPAPLPHAHILSRCLAVSRSCYLLLLLP